MARDKKRNSVTVSETPLMKRKEDEEDQLALLILVEVVRRRRDTRCSKTWLLANQRSKNSVDSKRVMPLIGEDYQVDEKRLKWSELELTTRMEEKGHDMPLLEDPVVSVQGERQVRSRKLVIPTEAPCCFPDV